VEFTTSEAANGIELMPGIRTGFTETGIDQVEFFIAPNPGEGLKPLVKDRVRRRDIRA